MDTLKTQVNDILTHVKLHYWNGLNIEQSQKVVIKVYSIAYISLFYLCDTIVSIDFFLKIALRLIIWT